MRPTKTIFLLLAISTQNALAVINGNRALAGQFPFQALLDAQSWPNDFTCGAIVVAEKWAMTSATCSKYANSLSFYVGSVTALQGHLHRSVRVVPHPSFDHQTFDNNVALVEVAVPFTFSTTVSPISYTETDFPAGTITMAAGWGLDLTGTIDDLRYIEMIIIANSNCQTSYKDYWTILPSEMCAKARYGGGLSNEDEGGPLFTSDKKQLVGIFSRGKPHDITRPDVFVRIATYKSWIDSVIKS